MCYFCAKINLKLGVKEHIIKMIYKKNFGITIYFALFSLFFVQQSYAQSDTLPPLINRDTLAVPEVLPSDSMQLPKANDTLAKKDSINTHLSPDAIDQTITYNCKDSMLFLLSGEKIYLYGKGDIISQEMKLNSAYVEISSKENYVYAKTVPDSAGMDYSPTLIQDNQTLKVSSVKHNFKSKKSLIKSSKTEQEQGFLHAEKAKMQTNEELHIEEGKFTSCNLDHPHFYIRLTKAKKLKSGMVVTGPMHFVIADIPLYIIGLPFGVLPHQRKNTSGFIIPEYGEDKNRGFFLRNGGYFFSINDHINTTLLGEFYSKGSWGTSLRTKFLKRYKYGGNLDLQYSKIQNSERVLPDYSSTNQFNVQGSFRQDPKANPFHNFSASLNFGSTKFDAFNATDINKYTESRKSSNINYQWIRPGKLFSNYNFGANVEQNSKTKIIAITLPSFSTSMRKIFPFKNLGTGQGKWYQKINVGLNINARNSVRTTDSTIWTRQTLTDMRHGMQFRVPISTSFSLFRFITVSPSFSAGARLYASKIEQTPITLVENGKMVSKMRADTIHGLFFPYDFNTSVSFSTQIFGMYRFKKGKLKAFRHLIKPSVSVGYRPDFSKEHWGYYGYDARNDRKYSYYSGGIFGGPPSGKSGTVSMGLSNDFEMKLKPRSDTIKKDRKIVLLRGLSISSSYNFAADSFRWSNITMAANTKLFKNIGVTFSAAFDPYAVDTTGQRIHKFEWDQNHRIARFRNARISMSGALKPFEFQKHWLYGDEMFYSYPAPDIAYTNAEVPWNLGVSYSLNISNQFDSKLKDFKKDILQTLSLNASLELTKVWKISGSTNFDFKTRKFAYARMSIQRDLHCWAMSFNLVPFGTLKSYTFRIYIKSSVFKGVEYKKQQDWDKSGFY